MMKHRKATDLLQRVCRFFSVFRHTCADAVSAAPAIAALAAVLALLLFRYCAGYSIPAATLAIFLTVIFLLPLKTAVRYLLLFLAAAVISLYLHEPESDPLEPYRIDRRFSGDFVVRITESAVDPALTAERMVRCGILKFRPAGEENWIVLTEPVSTGVISLAHGVGYGDAIRFSALLHEVEP
ncbi:MAG: hypothetical protein J6Q65_03050, partial [Lentisphaeria bacterium]|nr:hypothetical protein [Lentisphaeria bacterium]